MENTGVKDINNKYIRLDDIVIVSLPNGYGTYDNYKGVIGYEVGSFIVKNLISVSHGIGFKLYGPENTVDLRDLRKPLEKSYISNYGEVVSKWSDNLEYLEII
jgi:hypothetical protein